jgi:arginyl-tRNA synthetase
MIIDVLEQKLNEILDYDIKFHVIISNRPELCDYQCDDVFKLAKLLHKNPIEIGNNIIEKINNIENFNDYFESVTFVPPGFINIKVSNKLINNILKKMNSEEKFGLKKPEKQELFFLDYGGPNVAKPLHVGHMRTAIVGESIKRIISYMGHKTIADVHLGDYGLQIGQVIYGILEDNKKIEDITLEYLEETYPKISALCKENDEVKEKCATITKELQDGKEEYQKLWKVILEISGNDIKRLYKYLDVSFDLWQGESDAYSYIEASKQLLESKNLLEESDGALIVNVQKEGDQKEIPPFLFRKSNGAYLYGTTDYATIYERMKKYSPDHILYIVDNRQELHFEQVFRVCEKSGLTPNTKLEFLGYGTVNGMDGKPYKTRNGDAPKLDSLFQEVKDIFTSKKQENVDMEDTDLNKIVNAILKFADLQNSRERDYIFDIQKFSNVVGKTGPYVLYTNLRIGKILNNEIIDQNISDEIYNEVDHNLRLKLTEFNLALENAFNERKPHYLVEYIYQLSVLANNFYQNNHIASEENKQKKQDWLFVLNLTNHLLTELLKLIMIEVPSKM